MAFPSFSSPKLYHCHLHHSLLQDGIVVPAVTAFSPGYRTGTTILGLKVEPSVLGHRAGTKEGPLVPVGVKALQSSKRGRTL